MNQTNFFISIFFVCILLWTYEYLWLPSEDYHTASENRETILQPVHTIVQNAVQIEQSAIKHLEEIKTSGVKSILPSWSRDTPIVFLHIGKAGGTSFDAEIPLIIGGIAKRNVPQIYVGRLHFDWSWIEEHFPNGNVVTMFRQPVARAVSHYYFSKTLPFTLGRKMRRQSLSQFLTEDSAISNLMENRHFWQDGEAAGMWLAGTHNVGWSNGWRADAWVKSGSQKPDINAVELININFNKTIELAANRIDNLFWFGILEDVEKSMAMLAHQLGYNKKITLPRKRNSVKHPAPTSSDIETLSSLMPHDIWIYNYAKAVFNARWNYYQTGTFVQPRRPPIPAESSCISTQYLFKCVSGPFAGRRWEASKIPDTHRTIFSNYFT